MSTENQSDNTSPLAELVGNDKKFKTVEDLAKGKLEADNHIRNLETQLNELKNRASTYPELETILNDIKNAQTGQSQQTTSSNAGTTTTGTVLTEADIVALINKQNAAAQIAVKQEASMNEMKRVYGDKTEERLASVASSLGFTVDQLKAMAGTNPEAFKRLVDLKPQNQTSTTTSGTINTQSINNGTVDANTRNKAYYDKLRDTMGVRKFITDASLQVQLHGDMQRLGDAWYA